MSPNYAELLFALRPEAALVLGALAALGLDLTLFRSRSVAERLSLALVVAAVAVVASALLAHGGPRGPVYGGVLMFDTLAVATRVAVLGLTLLTLGVARSGALQRHPAEYVAVILFASTGFLLMAAAQQLLLVFVSLELASLSLYILVGLGSRRPAAAEAALKYFLFGGMAAAFLLFGFSLIYGVTGSIDLPQIAAQVAVQATNPLLLVGLVMVLVAFGFKSAAAPFHLWAPDVYEGAPAPSAALIASASKLAGFTLFVRLLWPGLRAAAGSASSLTGPGWLPAVAVLSASSLLLGNFAALAQTNVRRLLAYSAIAHAGALLLGVMAVGRSGPGALFYYASTYGLATVGAFGVVTAAARAGRCESITDLAGLYKRSPLLAGCLAVFILSLAGIPPLAGFFGKFFVFASAFAVGGISATPGWLALLAIAMSAVSLYYYLIVLKQALVAPQAPEAGPIEVPWVTAVTLVAAAGLILALGLFPNLILAHF